LDRPERWKGSAQHVRTWLAMAPGCNPAERFKQWPPQRYAQLVGELGNLPGLGVVIVGGPSDIETAKQIVEAQSHVVAPIRDLTGQLSLHETAAVIQECALIVGGDCGLLHVGACLGVPVVLLSGPARPTITGAYGNGVTVLESDHHCVGCYERELRIDPRCGSPQCMLSHQPDAVAAAVAELLTDG
jgi:ADP-heptose:LPS heptosyltransferase